MEMGVVYPDGEYELLLSVPNYDFNWQTSYTLSEPKLIPGIEAHTAQLVG